jgi:glutaredoxin 2
MMNKPYKLSSVEIVIHKIINDTRVNFECLDTQEAVHDIATLNWIRALIASEGIDFNQAINDYRYNLIKYIEEI